MNVLLVNIEYRKRYSTFIPLSFRRLYAKYISEDNNVEFINSGEIPKKHPDLICFSLIFLFNFSKDINWILTYKKKYPNAKILVGGISPSLMPEKFNKYLKPDELFLGRDLELEKLKPNFTDICNNEYSYGFTSRGCPNQCEWCCVPKLEGKHKIIDNWKSQIDITKKIFYCFDNNILACGSKHLDEVLTFCDENNIKIDMNQGMDAEILHKNKKIQEIFIKHSESFYNIRFSWDSHRVDESIKYVSEFLKQNNIRAKYMNVFYLLYDNPNNDIESFYERIKYISKLENPNWYIKLMRFKDFQTGNYIRSWGGFGDMISQMMGFTITGYILFNKGSTFYNYLFKDDLNSFINKLSILKDYLIKNKHKNSKDCIDFIKQNL